MNPQRWQYKSLTFYYVFVPTPRKMEFPTDFIRGVMDYNPKKSYENQYEHVKKEIENDRDRHENIIKGHQGLRATLDKLGAEGWEVYSILKVDSDVVYELKRPLESTTPFR